MAGSTGQQVVPTTAVGQQVLGRDGSKFAVGQQTRVPETIWAFGQQLPRLSRPWPVGQHLVVVPEVTET